ncbi:hypothetical protein NXS19_009241 [Fusarium pseudograminearum]|nr:hypothetical protein NXS19_009241 [Fusarium pseudograminearum]
MKRLYGRVWAINPCGLFYRLCLSPHTLQRYIGPPDVRYLSASDSNVLIAVQVNKLSPLCYRTVSSTSDAINIRLFFLLSSHSHRIIPAPTQLKYLLYGRDHTILWVVHVVTRQRNRHRIQEHHCLFYSPGCKHDSLSVDSANNVKLAPLYHSPLSAPSLLRQTLYPPCQLNRRMPKTGSIVNQTLDSLRSPQNPTS